MSVNVDDVVAAYMRLRRQKEEIENEVKDRTKTIKDKMDKLEAWLKTQMDAQGLTSVKTRHGTAFLTTTDYANVADWDAIIDFVKTNDSYEFLEKRISKIAVRDHIKHHKTVPPGVNYGTKLNVNIRKAAPAADIED